VDEPVFFSFPYPQTEVWGWFCSLFLKSAPAFRLVITISDKIPGFSHKYSFNQHFILRLMQVSLFFERA